jgi:hypothetical protein
MTFQNFQVDKIEAKINEFSAALEPEGMSLSPADARALGAVCSALANTSRWHATSIAANDLAALLHVANKWPPSQVRRDSLIHSFEMVVGFSCVCMCV